MKKKAPWYLLGFLWVVNFGFILWAMDSIPYMDEWEMFEAGGISSNFSWRWIFDFHNEHRIVFTKLITWILFLAVGGSGSLHIIFNFLLFTGTCLVLLRWTRRNWRSMVPWWFPILFIFTQNPVLYGNHLWAFQGCFHWCFFFAVLVLEFGFSPLAIGNKYIPLLIALSFLPWTISFGIPLSFSFLAFLLLSRAKEIGILKSVILTGALALSIGFWLQGYAEVKSQAAITLPWELGFWSHFLAELQLFWGISWTSVSSILGLATLIVIGIAFVKSIRAPFHLPRVGAMAFVCGLLAAFALVSFARASMGIEQAYSSRYKELIVILIPLLIFSFKEKERQGGLLLTFVFLGWMGHWSYSSYLNQVEEKQRGIRCLREKLAEIPAPKDIICPDLYPRDLKDKFARAQELQFHFVDEIISQKQ